MAGVTVAFTAVLVGLILVRAADATDGPTQDAVALASVAAAILASVIIAGIAVRDVRLRTRGFLPWLIGALSFALSSSLWLLAATASPLAALAYRGLHVPQGTIRFWDLSLVLQSVDCASWGFDVYVANNGCLKDPSIYGPGTLWAQWIPFVSDSNSALLGIAMMLVSSAALVLLARWSTGLGQFVILAAAVGGPWLLLLERGNLDAWLIWAAVVAAVVAGRPSLTRWWLVAVLIWILGTWKYYPFAMGLMLLPALRVRRGWTVIVGYAVASVAFVLITIDNLRLSAAANTAMASVGDFVVLGRIPLESRLALGAAGAVLVLLVAVAAFGWGASAGWTASRSLHIRWFVLAIGGAVLYLVPIVGSGFGYGYKASLLLTTVPLFSRMIGRLPRATGATGVIGLGMVAVSSVVVWNTTLATTAGILAAAIATGAAVSAFVRYLRPGVGASSSEGRPVTA